MCSCSSPRIAAKNLNLGREVYGVGMTDDDLLTKIRRGAYRNGDRPRHPNEPMPPDFKKTHTRTPQGLVEDYEREIERYFTYLEKWRTWMQAWHQRELELRKQFDADLLAAFGVTEHPRAQTFLLLAWTRGGAGGLERVVEEARPLAMLLRS